MERSLIDYLPPYLQAVREMRMIMDTEQPQFESLSDDIDQLLADQFIMEASLSGIKRWETVYGITAKDSDTIAERRARLIARISERLPFTIYTLPDQLATICGGKFFEILLDEDYYRISVGLFMEYYDNIEAVHDFLRRIVPANLVIFLSAQYPVEQFQNSNSFSLKSIDFHTGFYNLGECIRLDGRKRLDGSWLLGQVSDQGMRFHKLCLALYLKNRTGIRTACDYGVTIQNENIHRDHAFGITAVTGNQNETRQSETGFGLSVENPRCLGFCSITQDSMWRLDGSVPMDGSRKLDAQIIKEEI